MSSVGLSKPHGRKAGNGVEQERIKRGGHFLSEWASAGSDTGSAETMNVCHEIRSPSLTTYTWTVPAQADSVICKEKINTCYLKIRDWQVKASQAHHQHKPPSVGHDQSTVWKQQKSSMSLSEASLWWAKDQAWIPDSRLAIHTTRTGSLLLELSE